MKLKGQKKNPIIQGFIKLCFKLSTFLIQVFPEISLWYLLMSCHFNCVLFPTLIKEQSINIIIIRTKLIPPQNIAIPENVYL